MMKRLHFIYLAAPLSVALNAIPDMLQGVWRIVVALILAVILWGVVWIRCCTNKKLRPEFAILAIIPQIFYHTLQSISAKYAAIFNTPGWQNFNFFLWVAAVVVMVRALLPAPKEHKGRLATDSVFIFMTIITVAYSISCWATTHINL